MGFLHRIISPLVAKPSAASRKADSAELRYPLFLWACDIKKLPSLEDLQNLQCHLGFPVLHLEKVPEDREMDLLR